MISLASADREITMPISKTQQLIEHIRAQIASGTWPAGHRLPSRTQLMHQFDVSLTVVRDAQNYLRTLGELESVPGVGYFVAELGENQSHGP